MGDGSPIPGRWRPRRWAAQAACVAALAGALLGAGCVPAPETASVASRLEGGRAAGACDFPGVGLLRAGGSYCTATLIARRWILSAGHCTGGAGSFTVGAAGATSTVAVSRCEKHPDFDSSGRVFDFMVCELAEELALPLVPLLAPCEAEELRAGIFPLPSGVPVVVVGLGQPHAGEKRAVDLQSFAISYAGPLIGFRNAVNDDGPRPGDSGGPTFLQLADGTFRQIGVHHHGAVGGNLTDAFVPAGVPWIERATGADTTPCHLGSDWSPGPGCGALPTRLEGATGTFPACALEQRAPRPTCARAPDAGLVVDAGPRPDATGSGRDGGGGARDLSQQPALDAATERDLGATGPDAALRARYLSSGCDCHTSPASGAAPLPLALLLLALAGERARRRRA